MTRTAPELGTKTHYEILDGLRGVAAFMVVIFHTFEAYANDNRFTQKVNHGYLAVDFFFLLSGFVVAYAYDDRWGGMTQWEFYKRRLIRLQPMVVMGTVIGAALFYFGTAPIFPLIAVTPLWKMLLVMVLGFTLLPLPVSLDIRGWQEMHPLDGPAWSLFYEYVANLLYGVGVRKFSNKWLGVLVVGSAGLLFEMAVLGPRGDVVGGWALDRTQMHIGIARVLFPFFAGVLLMRLGKRIRIPGGFAVCSVLIVAVLSVPRFGGPQHLWVNGLYEWVCIVAVFPAIVAMGAGSPVRGEASIRVCRLFGAISYPLYITHYALIYVYTAVVTRDKLPAVYGAEWGVGLFVASVAIAYGCLKLYDEPVRGWLSRRFLARRSLAG